MMLAAGLAPATFDLLALGLLLLFALWGWWRGGAGQALSLALLLVALGGARFLAPRLEGPLSQTASLAAGDLPVAAWVAAVVAILLVGGVLAQAIGGPAAGRPPPTRPARWIGALLGVVKGLLLLVVAGYAVLYALPEAQARSLGGQSRVVPALRAVRGLASKALALPRCTDEAAAIVEGRVDLGP